MTTTGEQLYSQQSFRDGSGDILIKMVHEETRPSGLVVPREMGFVSIQSTISSAQKVNASETGLVFANFSAGPTQNEITHFAVEPKPVPEFKQLSSRAIFLAHERLVAQDLNPVIWYGAPVEIDKMLDHEREMMRSVKEGVDVLIKDEKKKHDEGPELPTGQYL